MIGELIFLGSVLAGIKKRKKRKMEPTPKNDIQKFVWDYLNGAAPKIGLDPHIAYKQIKQESAFNPKAKSPVGAQGLAQFMPGTWKDFGKGGDPFNPADAMGAYIRYMRYLFGIFPGRTDLVLAAYNWGPGRSVLKNAFKNKIPVSGYIDKLPKETQNYLKKIFLS